jgi:hypothetical protein
MRIETEEARYGHHWWSVAELATTTETVRPKNLALLLPDVTDAARPGRRPVHLGDVNEDTDPD